MNRRKCLRKIHKTLNIMCRGDNRNRLNVRSIVVDGLPIKHWYDKMYNNEISKEEFVDYYSKALMRTV